jgi:chromosome segregation and condensation protein ScpB
MRETSIEARNYIKQSIGEKQAEVYTELLKHGPCTGRELDARLGVDAHKRLSELKELGMVKEITKRKCSITGRNAIVWAGGCKQGRLF